MWRRALFLVTLGVAGLALMLALVAAPARADGRGGPVPPKPLPAASPVVWVEASWAMWKYWYWPLRDSRDFVDRYTGTYFRWGPCHAGAKCIRIREAHLMPKYAGLTYVYFYLRVIEVDPSFRRASYATKRDLLTHELGHAMGVYLHNPRCTSVMFSWIQCWGHVPPYRFTYAEQQVLRRN